MEHQVGLGRFLERRAKGGDQRVRQPIDEADGVRHQQLAAVWQPQLTHQRVERHEQGVRGVSVRAGQHVEQRRLAGVGVADERNRRHRRLVTTIAQLRAAPPNLLDVVAEDVNPRADSAAIGLELGFAGSAGADAAAQT